MRKIAWTGGTSPNAYKTITQQEKHLVSAYFREQIADCGREWFFSSPFGVLDYARTLWNRARHDAHATMRG